MRSCRLRLAALAALLAVPSILGLAGTATADPADRPKTPTELKAAVEARAATVQARSTTAAVADSIGNDIFRVHVEQTPGLGLGSFTVTTGPRHPSGPGLDVLFGNGVPGTSYMIVRNVAVPDTPNGTELTTDYVQGQLVTNEHEVSLDDHAFTRSIELGSSGFTASWQTYFGRLVQTLEVEGTTFADTRIAVTTRIEPNDSGSNDRYQIQYTWDVAAGADDGPALQTQQADTVFRPWEAVGVTEYTLRASENHLVTADNDANPVPPNLGIGVSAAGPGWLVPTPTRPDSVKYVCWPRAIYSPIGEYEVDETYNVATPSSDCTNSNGTDDSAVVSLWTAEANGDGAIEVSASLFSSPRTPYATAMRATPVLLNPPVFTATLRDTTANRPLVGRTVSFAVGNTVRCRAVTDATGTARCGTLLDRLAAVLAFGYTARYGGNAIWAPASARAGIL